MAVQSGASGAIQRGPRHGAQEEGRGKFGNGHYLTSHRLIMLSKAQRTPLWKTLSREEGIEERKGTRVGWERTWGGREERGRERQSEGKGQKGTREFFWVRGPGQDHHLLRAHLAPRWRCVVSKFGKQPSLRAQNPNFPSGAFMYVALVWILSSIQPPNWRLDAALCPLLPSLHCLCSFWSTLCDARGLHVCSISWMHVGSLQERLHYLFDEWKHWESDTWGKKPKLSRSLGSTAGRQALNPDL